MFGILMKTKGGSTIFVILLTVFVIALIGFVGQTEVVLMSVFGWTYALLIRPFFKGYSHARAARLILLIPVIYFLTGNPSSSLKLGEIMWGLLGVPLAEVYVRWLLGLFKQA